MTKGTEIETGTLIENEIVGTGGIVTEREKETETVLLMTRLIVQKTMTMIRVHTVLGAAKGYVYQGIILSHTHLPYQDQYFTGTF